MYHWYGNVSCKGVNVSNNEVNQISGILIQQPSTKSSISFSSFNSNIASGFECLEFYQCSHDVSYTNVISNSQNSNTYGIIFTESSAQLTMKHCAIYGKSPFSQVFSIDSSLITCDNCSIGSVQQRSFSTTNTAPKPFINSYEYLELEECKVTPIKPLHTPEQTPGVTPGKTCESNSFTWKSEDYINFYRLLEYIFLLCCLHPDPAKDIWYDIQ